MKIVSAAEMREIDRVTSAQFGVPSLTLMENAGAAVADFIVAEYPRSKNVLVLCGKGNNGGDGFLVARKLHESGRSVRVVLLAEPAEVRGDAAEMLRKLPLEPLVIRAEPELQREELWQADVLVDAILGTGFRPPVSGLYAAAIRAINQHNLPVVAVDIPSGADADVLGAQLGAVARADALVTFTAPRPAHVFGRLTSGPAIISPIGSPDEAITSSLQLHLTTPRDIAALLGPRDPDSNKGKFGHVLVLGGSVGKAGAAAMAGMAALRAGAGLSTVATAKSMLATVAGFHPELMTEPLEETEAGSISLRALEYGRLESLLAGKTVLALGPGISRHPETAALVRHMVAKCKLPTVLDADGLNAFEGKTAELNGQGRVLVLTPHPGEMARLAGSSVAAVQQDRVNLARSFAHERGVILVLKGNRTLVASPEGEVWVNTTGNPGMATGGTGDILTGMTAGFLAQHPRQAFQAVVAAVYLHGLAGDVACESMGEHSLVATDLLPALPQAFRRVRETSRPAVVRIGSLPPAT